MDWPRNISETAFLIELVTNGDEKACASWPVALRSAATGLTTGAIVC